MKDIIDTATLLLTHDAERAADGTNPGRCVIDVGRVVAVTTADWGWYTTVSDNLATVAAAAAELLPGPAAAAVTHRAGEITSTMAGAPKSVRWRLRAKVGRKLVPGGGRDVLVFDSNVGSLRWARRIIRDRRPARDGLAAGQPRRRAPSRTRAITSAYPAMSSYGS